MDDENRKIGKYIKLTKIGNIEVIIWRDSVIKLSFLEKEHFSTELTEEAKRIFMQINQYLDGSRISFDIPYQIDGSTFEMDVLRAISKIPYGQTISYKTLAKNAGYPNAYRACGTVCKKNPLPLIIPCHRVIKSNGDIGAYAGGVTLKRHLIEMEIKRIKS